MGLVTSSKVIPRLSAAFMIPYARRSILRARVSVSTHNCCRLTGSKENSTARSLTMEHQRNVTRESREPGASSN
eukprot:4967140-Pyramimonas_sp.AAC.1